MSYKLSANHYICLIVIPSGGVAKASFVNDFNEAVSQARNLGIREVCLIHTKDDQGGLLSFSRLALPYKSLLVPSETSVVASVNAGLKYVREQGGSALLVCLNSILAPNTFSEVLSVAATQRHAGIVTAWDYCDQRGDQADSSAEQSPEESYLEFLEGVSLFPRTTVTDRPHCVCTVISAELLRYGNLLPIDWGGLAIAFWAFSVASLQAGFSSLQVNSAFCAARENDRLDTFPADEELSRFEEAFDCAADNHRIVGETTAAIIDRFTAIRSLRTEHPTLLIDLSGVDSREPLVAETAIQLALAIHRRESWETSLLLPQRDSHTANSVLARFAGASVVESLERATFDFAISPALPSSIEHLLRVASSTPRFFAVLLDAFSRKGFSDIRGLVRHQTLLSLTASLAQGVICIGEEAAAQFTSNAGEDAPTPTCVLFPSLYWKEYHSEKAVHSKLPPGIGLVLHNSSQPIREAQEVVEALQKAFPRGLRASGGLSVGNSKRDPSAREHLLSGAALMQLCTTCDTTVIPLPTESSLLFIGHALAAEKTVITRRNYITQEFVKNWTGPRKLLLTDSNAELIDACLHLQTPAYQTQLVRQSDVDDRGQPTHWRWKYVSKVAADFMMSAATLPAATQIPRAQKLSLYRSFQELAEHPVRAQLALIHSEKVQLEEELSTLRLSTQEGDGAKEPISQENLAQSSSMWQAFQFLSRKRP